MFFHVFQNIHPCIRVRFLDTGQYVRFLLPSAGRLPEEQAELEAAC